MLDGIFCLGMDVTHLSVSQKQYPWSPSIEFHVVLLIAGSELNRHCPIYTTMTIFSEDRRDHWPLCELLRGTRPVSLTDATGFCCRCLREVINKPSVFLMQKYGDHWSLSPRNPNLRRREDTTEGFCMIQSSDLSTMLRDKMYDHLSEVYRVQHVKRKMMTHHNRKMVPWEIFQSS